MSASQEQQWLILRCLGGNPSEGPLAYNMDNAITCEGIFAKNYFLELARGTISGQKSDGIIGVDNSIGTTSQIVGLIDSGPLYEYQTSAQNLEILSGDTADTSSGTGARTVLVEGLDDNYEEQSETVTLNGTSTVPLTKQYLRTNRITVKTAGSLEANKGQIILRLSGAGVIQSLIEATINVSRISVYTVPADKTAYLWSTNVSTGKGKDIDAVLSVRGFEGLFIEVIEIPIYQSANPSPFIIPSKIPEKSDIQIKVVSSNPNTSVFVSISLQLIDND